MFGGIVPNRGVWRPPAEARCIHACSWWLVVPLVVACGVDARVSGDHGWPDALDIAFIDDGDRGHIWLATAEDMQDSARALEGEYHTRHLGWSPCGDEIAMPTEVESTQIVTVSAGDPRVVAELWMAYTGFQIGSGPWWSPDGRYIAAIGSVNISVGVHPSCGWGQHLYICEVSTRECRDADRGAGTAVEHRTGAEWSTGGDSILAIRRVTWCTTDPAEEETVGAWTVIAYHLDGADAMPTGLGEPTDAAWSPNDDRVVVAVERDVGPALLVWDRGSGVTETVATAVPSAVQIEWLPDTRRWLLVTASEPPSLLTFDATNGEQLDARAGLSDVVLAPDGLRAIAIDHDRMQHVLLDLRTREAVAVPGDHHWWRPRCAAE